MLRPGDIVVPKMKYVTFWSVYPCDGHSTVRLLPGTTCLILSTDNNSETICSETVCLCKEGMFVFTCHTKERQTWFETINIRECA